MRTPEILARARVQDGSEFVLAREGEDSVIRVDGKTLMSSRMYHSEQVLAEHTLDRVKDAQAVLVGGLGLGFTLRAVLNRVGKNAKVTVAELVPELVAWNRTHLAALHDAALDDPRCEVVVGDVYDVVQRAVSVYDVMLLDVDNGPVAMSQAKNQRLYAERWLRACRAALKPNGLLAFWSAGPSARFERRLTAAGFAVEVLRVSARKGSRASHVIFLAQPTSQPAAGGERKAASK